MKELQEKQDKFKEIFGAFEKTAAEIKENINKVKESKAYGEDTVSCDKLDYLCHSCDNLYSMIYALRDYINESDSRIWDALYRHQTNHVPSLQAGPMKKFIKAVGLEDSFEVVKPQIYISASRNGNKTFNVDLGSIKKN